MNGWIELRPIHLRLQSIVERYLVRRMTPLQRSLSARILPRSGSSLFLDLGPKRAIHSSDRFLLNGLYETFYCLPIEAGVEIDQMIIEFTPGGFASFTKTPLFHFRSQLVPVFGVLGSRSEWDLLAETILPLSIEARITQIEGFLVSKIREERVDQRLVSDLVTEMREENRFHSRKDVEWRSSRSIRQVERRFLDITGMSRRSLFTFFRFERAKKMLENRNDSLTGIALDAGYYDQSQFNHEIKKRTGLLPGDLKGGVPPCINGC